MGGPGGWTAGPGSRAVVLPRARGLRPGRRRVPQPGGGIHGHGVSGPVPFWVIHCLITLITASGRDWVEFGIFSESCRLASCVRALIRRLLTASPGTTTNPASCASVMCAKLKSGTFPCGLNGRWQLEHGVVGLPPASNVPSKIFALISLANETRNWTGAVWAMDTSPSIVAWTW